MSPLCCVRLFNNIVYNTILTTQWNGTCENKIFITLNIYQLLYDIKVLLPFAEELKQYAADIFTIFHIVL
jgi:hypothetical protein